MVQYASGFLAASVTSVTSVSWPDCDKWIENQKCGADREFCANRQANDDK